MFEFAESDPSLSKAEAEPIEEQLRTDLLKAQYSRLKLNKRALLIVVAGIDGVGKGESVALLNEWMDARHIRTLAFGKPSKRDKNRPFLWRFWNHLPAKGKTGIVFGSWYAPLIKEAARKKPNPEKIARYVRAIKQFEHTLAQNEVQVVKLWYHLSQSAQKARTERLLSSPDTAWRVQPEDLKVNKKFDRLRTAGELLISHTNDEHAPWVVIPAADTDMRDVRTGEAVLTALRKRRIEPSQPAPSSPDQEIIQPVPTLSGVDFSPKLANGDYDTLLPQWQSRLALAARSKAFADIPLVLVFEGQDAAGKGGAIRRITRALDPRQFRAIPISAPTDVELSYPYLWRFWRDLPPSGKVSIFDRSWYGRVLVERVEGLIEQDVWERAYDEINQFESQLIDSGAMVLKFWLAVSKDEQLERFREREESTFKSFKITPEDWRNREQWDAYKIAADQMFARTHTADCPWQLVAANDKRHARITVLQHLVSSLEKRL